MDFGGIFISSWNDQRSPRGRGRKDPMISGEVSAGCRRQNGKFGQCHAHGFDRQDSALSALALNPAGPHYDVCLHSVTRCAVPNYSHETHGMTRTSLRKTEKIQTKDL